MSCWGFCFSFFHFSLFLNITFIIIINTHISFALQFFCIYIMASTSEFLWDSWWVSVSMHFLCCFVLFYFCLFCLIPMYYFCFILCCYHITPYIPLEACLLSNERQKRGGSGREGRYLEEKGGKGDSRINCIKIFSLSSFLKFIFFNFILNSKLKIFFNKKEKRFLFFINKLSGSHFILIYGKQLNSSHMSWTIL